MRCPHCGKSIRTRAQIEAEKRREGTEKRRAYQREWKKRRRAKPTGDAPA